MHLMHRMCELSMTLVLVDSVEQGDKIVQTAIDNFGRIGMLKMFFNPMVNVLLII